MDDQVIYDSLRWTEFSASACDYEEAMNVALTLSISEWVCFAGGGTLVQPGVLASIEAELTNGSAERAMVYGSVRVEGDGPDARDGEIYISEFSFDRLNKQNICHQAIFYRLSTLRELGGFDSKYPVNADWALNLKGWHSFGGQYVDLVIANFVRGGLSTTEWDQTIFSDLEDLWDAHSNHSHE